METPLGKPEEVFHDSIPGENGVGLRFRAEFFNIFSHPNFGNPNNTLNSPLFSLILTCKHSFNWTSD